MSPIEIVLSEVLLADGTYGTVLVEVSFFDCVLFVYRAHVAFESLLGTKRFQAQLTFEAGIMSFDVFTVFDISQRSVRSSTAPLPGQARTYFSLLRNLKLLLQCSRSQRNGNSGFPVST